MRSKAQIHGHPLHPMLISFPVAFMVGAVVFDIWGWVQDREWMWSAGAYLNVATIATGLLAGAAGFIDYLYVVPPKSSAKSRATQHMLINVTALGLMALAWFFRDLNSYRPDLIAVVLECLAMLCLTVGGWLGGTLVYRNQIGVDHRYADAGKWQEQTLEGRSGESIEVPGAGNLHPGQMMLLHVNGQRLVLMRTSEGYSALDDRCSHRGGSLAGGILACQVVTCPWHGSQFDAADGRVKAGPATTSVARHAVRQEGGKVFLTL